MICHRSADITLQQNELEKSSGEKLSHKDDNESTQPGLTHATYPAERNSKRTDGSKFKYSPSEQKCDRMYQNKSLNDTKECGKERTLEFRPTVTQSIQTIPTIRPTRAPLK
jgi:hypothetical protein